MTDFLLVSLYTLIDVYANGHKDKFEAVDFCCGFILLSYVLLCVFFGDIAFVAFVKVTLHFALFKKKHYEKRVAALYLSFYCRLQSN